MLCIGCRHPCFFERYILGKPQANLKQGHRHREKEREKEKEGERERKREIQILLIGEDKGRKKTYQETCERHREREGQKEIR